MRFLLPIIFILFTLPAVADDRVPLNQDPQLEADLRVMAQGYFMRKNCDEISMRLFRSIGLLNRLKSRGRALGYSDDELEAYFDDKSEKARVEALARAELRALGLDFEDPSTFCPVARSQIAAQQGFGVYFRAN